MKPVCFQNADLRQGQHYAGGLSIQGYAWLFIFVWTENILKTKLFENGLRHDNHVISLTEFSSNTNTK